MFEAKRPEFVLRNLAGQEGAGFAAEGLDLFPDHVIVLQFEFLANAECVFNCRSHINLPIAYRD